MIEQTCKICGKQGVFQILISKDYFLGSKKEYEYANCLHCNSLFLMEIPENLSQLYENYYSFLPPKPLSQFKLSLYKLLLKRYKLFPQFLCYFLNDQDDLPIKSLVPIKNKLKERVLDVGCGSGSLLKTLYKIGFKNCLGIDPYLKADIKYSTGLNVLKKEFMELDEKFDLIMFHHVFEHFINLKDVLKHIYKLLSKRGICIIRMPDISSYSFLRYKENWFSIHAPFHVSLPSRQGMQTLVKDTGLSIKAIIGEQLIEFFLYSKAHELGVSDYDKYGNRKFIEKFGLKNPPPLHIKDELKKAKQRLKQVKKYDLCDWSIYYLEKEELNDTDF